MLVVQENELSKKKQLSKNSNDSQQITNSKTKSGTGYRTKFLICSRFRPGISFQGFRGFPGKRRRSNPPPPSPFPPRENPLLCFQTVHIRFVIFWMTFIANMSCQKPCIKRYGLEPLTCLFQLFFNQK